MDPKNPSDDHIRSVALAVGGERARWAYGAFDWVNSTLFEGQLPMPFLDWSITAHGACLGWTKAQDAHRVPHIRLHPSTLGGAEKPDPWGVPQDLLGERYALDVLIHECMHVSQHYLLGGRGKGTSSHECETWIAEVNRIAPLLGIEGVQAERRSRPRSSERGECRQRRSTWGNLPGRAVSTFPCGVRRALDPTAAAEYFRGSSLPFDAHSARPVAAAR